MRHNRHHGRRAVGAPRHTMSHVSAPAGGFPHQWSPVFATWMPKPGWCQPPASPRSHAAVRGRNARAPVHAVAAGAAARAARLRPPALALMLLNNVHPQVVYSRHALLQRQPLGHLLHQRAQHGVDVGVRRPAMQLPVETAQQHVARAELRGELPEGARRHERRRRWRTRKRHVAGAAQRPQRTRHQHVGSVRGRLAQQARRVLA
eukprot:258421-Chlamydomonas_euryale.AAC.1